MSEILLLRFLSQKTLDNVFTGNLEIAGKLWIILSPKYFAQNNSIMNLDRNFKGVYIVKYYGYYEKNVPLEIKMIIAFLLSRLPYFIIIIIICKSANSKYISYCLVA